MTRPPTSFRPGRRQLLTLAIVALLAYVLLPQIGSFRQSFNRLGQAAWGPLLLAAGCVALTYGLAALTYWLMAVKPLRYLVTVFVQVAGNFADRLLPAGIGGIGANYAYLRHARHSPAQAIGVVTANNLIGLAGHLLLMTTSVLAFRHHLNGFEVSYHPSVAVWYAAGLIAIAAGVLLAGRHRQLLRRNIVQVGRQLAAYRHHPFKLGGALLSSIGLTFSNALALYFCLHALGILLAWPTVIVVFSLGIVAGTVTPTPGGIGGIEAGLVAGLAAYGVPLPDALAAVLLYRLLSYWLALLIGAGAFIAAVRLGYFSYARRGKASA